MRTMHIMKSQNLASKVKQFEKHKQMLNQGLIESLNKE